jgi:cobalt-zinc-cadmium efflux system protein
MPASPSLPRRVSALSAAANTAAGAPAHELGDAPDQRQDRHQRSTRAHDHSHDQAHDHTHDHAHSHVGGHHHHLPASFDRAFAIGIALNTAFVIAETIYGLRANSLSLVADAGHNLGDVLGLAMAWAATVLARRQPTERRTYGLRRFSVLAAMGNAGVLLVTVGAIAWEAIQRLRHPDTVATTTVMVVATIGIAINLVTALGFMRGKNDDLNIRGAFLHMLGDAATSAGVVVAALLIALTGRNWIDPIVSLIISALIAWSTWSLARDSVNLALDAVPKHIDPAAVRALLARLDGVTDVHDLHIWAMSTTDVALTAHLLRPCGCNEDAMIASATRTLAKDFGIGHVTLQLERGLIEFPCEQALPGAL